MVDGRGLEQIEVDAAAMPDIQSNSCAANEVVLATELCHKRKQLHLLVIQNLAMHISSGQVKRSGIFRDSSSASDDL